MLDIFSALGKTKLFVYPMAPIFLLGFLIFIHEFGHFFFAKLFGVGVERFSFGFGPRIFGMHRNGTDYRVSWIPLGGYVKMVGDDPFEEVAPEMREKSFLHKPVWQKLIIVLAGPMFNLLVPILLFAGLYMAGRPEATSWVGMVEKDSPAALAGIQEGDRIVAVGDTPVQLHKELADALDALPLGAKTNLTLSREGRTRVVEVTLRIEPGLNQWGDQVQENGLGVDYRAPRPFIGVDPSSSSPAYAAGVRSGDLIKSINGQPVDWWYQVRDSLSSFQGEALELTVQRGKEGELKFKVPRAPYELSEVGAPEPRAAVTSEMLAAVHPGAAFGLFPYELFINRAVEGKPAATAGLRSGDMIYQINGHPIARWTDLKKMIEAPADEVKRIVVIREGALKTFQVKPESVTMRDASGQAHKEGQIGIAQADVLDADQMRLRLDPFHALAKGAAEAASLTYISGKLLARVIVGDIPLQESLGGPISIVSIAAQAAWSSIFHYVSVMALISVSLGLINLLPIPLLDGGHILFFTIEFIRGRPVSMRFREVSQQIGLIFLFILMAFALANDVRMNFLR